MQLRDTHYVTVECRAGQIMRSAAAAFWCGDDAIAHLDSECHKSFLSLAEAMGYDVTRRPALAAE
ncbi:hypothetical protein [Frigidibacter sp. MR17.24]|uniref:hypothetical protein n=1 Tax=Frigidibacter sp. MR17.24 TaxID=3127345 RepID=UPI003012CA75